MNLSQQQLFEFEEKRAGLDKRIEQGFKWPARTGFYANFKKLEKEIGSTAMDNTEKAAYLRYACDSRVPGEFTPRMWSFSANNPISHKKELEHFKACKLKLERFDNYITIKSAHDQLKKIYNQIQAICKQPQIAQDQSFATNDQLKIIHDQIQALDTTIKKLEPDAERGKKVINGAKEAAKQTLSKKQQCYPEMKKEALKIAIKHPKYSISQAADKLSKKFDICTKTIKKVCKKELEPLNKTQKNKK